ncbi:PepSY-associated TM helix domain-containing protein [Emcibacter sp.]|uniref:PepSY-associated TM helix domain-containing protein n=1 Tax=Emcibacter sp. TaxID=1979954 RepID=UPI003A9155D3
MRQFILSAHKYISLSLVVIWLLQIASGFIVLFAPEINNLLFYKPHVKLDLPAVEKSLSGLEQRYPAWKPRYFFTTDAEASRFDVYFYNMKEDGLGSRAFRIDGDGEVLADRMMKYDVFNRLSELHEMLWIEDYGGALIGISGIFLTTNLVLGLVILWPNRRNWKRFFEWPSTAPAKIKFYHWHRTVGLCVVIPAFFLCFTGVLNAYLGDFRQIFGDPWPEPQVAVEGRAPLRQGIGFTEAMETAFALYPDAKISIVTLPDDAAPYYAIRLLQEGEVRTVYGNTRVYVDSATKEILGNQDQLKAPFKAKLFSSFFALHVGNWGGLSMRILILITGGALLFMSVIGIALWWKRRNPI